MRLYQITARLARLTTLGLLACGSVGLLGCAVLHPQTEGRSGPLTWQATELQLQHTEWASRELYSFTLVLQETSGTPITFTTLAVQLQNSPDAPPVWWEQTGPWTLPAHGELRLPLTSTRYCPYVACTPRGALAPQWALTLSGTDGRGTPVRYALEVRLPASPAAARRSALAGAAVALRQEGLGPSKE